MKTGVNFAITLVQEAAAQLSHAKENTRVWIVRHQINRKTKLEIFGYWEKEDAENMYKGLLSNQPKGITSKPEAVNIYGG
jgi:Holliday junction resolvasome RuvABC DNA-binding subunit